MYKNTDACIYFQTHQLFSESSQNLTWQNKPLLRKIKTKNVKLNIIHVAPWHLPKITIFMAAEFQAALKRLA